MSARTTISTTTTLWYVLSNQTPNGNSKWKFQTLLTAVCVVQLPVVASSDLVVHLHVHICPLDVASVARQEQDRRLWHFLEIRPHRRALESVCGHRLFCHGVQCSLQVSEKSLEIGEYWKSEVRKGKSTGKKYTGKANLLENDNLLEVENTGKYGNLWRKCYL